MQHSIVVNDKKIEYTLTKTKRSKRISMSVCCGGVVTVRAPRLIPSFLIKRFVSTRSEWLLKSVLKLEKVEHVQPRSKKDFILQKYAALSLVQKRIQELNEHYQFEFKKIIIRNQKTRWGSCSKNKTLSFNYKIVFLPNHLVDYLIVHELCHLQEFNHGSAFWKLVEQTIPDYTYRRQALKLIRM